MIHICFDIESRLDPAKAGSSLDAQESFARDKFGWEDGEDFPFLPLFYHLPWITCWLSWDDTRGSYRRGTLIGDCAGELLSWADNARLVTFNGRRFDVPLLENVCYRKPVYGGRWFRNLGPGYALPRNRYNSNSHWDVMEFSSNFGAASLGTLSMHAQHLGLGQKKELGFPFHRMPWLDMEEKVTEYCQQDVELTWQIYMRQLKLSGVNTEAMEACYENPTD